MTVRTMYTAAAAAFLSSAANLPAETFYWKNDTVKTENWKSYADLDNWAVGTSATAGDADRLPSATDDLFYGENYNNSWSTSLWMDLGGERRELR